MVDSKGAEIVMPEAVPVLVLMKCTDCSIWSSQQAKMNRLS